MSHSRSHCEKATHGRTVGRLCCIPPNFMSNKQALYGTMRSQLKSASKQAEVSDESDGCHLQSDWFVCSTTSFWSPGAMETNLRELQFAGVLSFPKSCT